MHAGILDQLITLQQRVETRNETGEVTWAWTDWATVWAAVEPLRAQELFAAQQVLSQAHLKIRLRYLPGIHSTMRIRHVLDDGSPGDTRYYQIEGPPINVRTANDEIHLLCSEREAQGWRN